MRTQHTGTNTHTLVYIYIFICTCPVETLGQHARGHVPLWSALERLTLGLLLWTWCGEVGRYTGLHCCQGAPGPEPQTHTHPTPPPTAACLLTRSIGVRLFALHPGHVYLSVQHRLSKQCEERSEALAARRAPVPVCPSASITTG